MPVCVHVACAATRTIWSASMSTVLIENLRLQKLNRSSKDGPRRSITCKHCNGYVRHEQRAHGIVHTPSSQTRAPQHQSRVKSCEKNQRSTCQRLPSHCSRLPHHTISSWECQLQCKPRQPSEVYVREQRVGCMAANRSGWCMLGHRAPACEHVLTSPLQDLVQLGLIQQLWVTGLDRFLQGWSWCFNAGPQLLSQRLRCVRTTRPTASRSLQPCVGLRGSPA